MTEFIRYTPESETSPERYDWDNFIRALDTLADMTAQTESEGYDHIDIVSILETMEHEDFEDAVVLLFNYATMITVPEGQSSELQEVWAFLSEHGIFEQDS